MNGFQTWTSIGVAGQGVVDKLVETLSEIGRDCAAFQIKTNLPKSAAIAHPVLIRRKLDHRHYRPQRR